MTLSDPPRSTAYYYGDLEKIKRKTDQEEEIPRKTQLNDYVDTAQITEADPKTDIPPLRDRTWSLPEYSTPENGRIETYSTAGTIPLVIPQPKEEEPLLAELEIVGRVPLTQLESGVRRSRSWYLCCPEVEQDASRESSWRYSSLRPVTTAPMRRQIYEIVTATQSSTELPPSEELAVLRAERTRLQRALAAERTRAAEKARAHDARLAELHGVIAELVRRREKPGIPEEGSEERSEECESTTQPAGELEDQDPSRTDQNDTSSQCSGAELSRGREPPRIDRVPPKPGEETGPSEDSLCLTDRCCEWAAGGGGAGDGGDGGDDCTDSGKVYASPGGCSARVAARVRLPRIHDRDQPSPPQIDDEFEEEDEILRVQGKECLSCAAWRARCRRVRADAALHQHALHHATHTAHRLWVWCGRLEASCGALSAALGAADRALELYDVLLALAETQGDRGTQRAAAEAVGARVLSALSAPRPAGLSPGPWLQPPPDPATVPPWSPHSEAALRAACAGLKADTAALRATAPHPGLFAMHEPSPPPPAPPPSMAAMEEALLAQEECCKEEGEAIRRLKRGEEEWSTRRHGRHWLDHTETDL